jgi:hypothetical protein
MEKIRIRDKHPGSATHIGQINAKSKKEIFLLSLLLLPPGVLSSSTTFFLWLFED